MVLLRHTSRRRKKQCFDSLRARLRYVAGTAARPNSAIDRAGRDRSGKFAGFNRVRVGLQHWLVVLCLWMAALPTQAVQTVVLAWDPNPETNLGGYKFYYGVASRTYFNVQNVGNTTSGSASNLLPGITYYFAITAYNNLGAESDFSEEIVYTVPVINNVPPTLDVLPDLTLADSAMIQVVPLSGITSGSPLEMQTLTVTATSSDPEVIPHPSVTYASPSTTGILRFAPVGTSSGLVTITVTVNDGQAQTSRAFLVNVNPLKRLFKVKSVTRRSTNGWTIRWESHPGRTYRVLSKTRLNEPKFLYCSDYITAVSTNTAWADNSRLPRPSRFYLVEFIENLPPTLNPVKNVSLFTNAPPQIVQLSGISSGATNEIQTLTVTATSSYQALIPNPVVTYTSPASTAELRLIAAPNRSGSATITVTVSDGKAQTSCSFVVTVNPTGHLFRINSLTRAPGGGLTVDWYSQPGLSYRVLYKTGINQTNWTVRSPNITAAGNNTSWTDAAPGSSAVYTIEMFVPQ
jgi:hypothetical protein